MVVRPWDLNPNACLPWMYGSTPIKIVFWLKGKKQEKGTYRGYLTLVTTTGLNFLATTTTITKEIVWTLSKIRAKSYCRAANQLLSFGHTLAQYRFIKEETIMAEWVRQLQNSVNTLEKLKTFINVTAEEEQAITGLKTRWGTTPYFAALMDPNDSGCPVRKQVIPSLREKESRLGIPNYLV
jgi:hypothetical protein